MARYAEWNRFVQNLKTDKYGETNVNEIGIAFEKATADVVPKSESIPLDVHEALKQRAVEKAKAEVAREIFEDIHGKMLCFFPASSFVSAPNTTHYQLLDMLAELKKKYTEGE